MHDPFFKRFSRTAEQPCAVKEGSGVLTRMGGVAGFGFKYLPDQQKVRHGVFALLRIPANLRGRKLLVRGTFATLGDRPGGSKEQTAISLFFTSAPDTIEAPLHRAVLYLNSEPCFMSVPVELEPGGDVFVQVYIHKSVSFSVEATGLHLIVCGEDPQRTTWLADGSLDNLTPLDTSKRWTQNGKVVAVTWLGQTFRSTMPQGWKLSSLDEQHVNVINDFLFGPLELALFEKKRFRLQPLHAMDTAGRTYRYDSLLSFSAGEDSTAALVLLPEKRTAAFHLRRSFTQYRMANGALVDLGEKRAEWDAVKRVPGCIVIPSDFEMVAVSVGTKKGLADSFGYVLFGVMLADFLGARSVSTGSQLDTMMMENGRAFVDVFERKGSQMHYLRQALAHVGLDLVCPAAATSEVLTNKLCRMNADRFLAFSCPNTDENHQPCGVCYKCFRKSRFADAGDLKEPSAATLEFFDKVPLKMAAPTMYAVQKSGYKHPTLDKYKGDLSFLERYYPYALENFVPDYLREDVRAALERHGIEPMTAEDELSLRSVGQVFMPAEHDELLCFPPRLFDGRKRRTTS